MGIGVHKILGYGMDVKTQDYRINDDRFNAESLDWEKLESLTKEEFVKFTIDYQSTLDKEDVDKYYLPAFVNHLLVNFDATNNIKFNFEYGLDFITIVPPTIGNWCRYNDTIDYYECFAKGEPINRVDYIDGGIYPYNGLYMRKSTGKQLSLRDPVDSLLSRIRYLPGRVDLLDILNKLGFASLEEYENEIVPQIPIEVRLFCEFTKIFKDNKTINELKPCLYTYWS